MTFKLTLDDPTKEWLSAFYQNENTILEYGSGGSTFLALESNPHTKVYCCETDKKWLDRVVKESIDKNLIDRLVPIHMNVGPTGAWGYPINKTADRAKLFKKVSKVIWDKLNEDKVSPNVVLVDGRWRKGCFLTSILNCTHPFTLIWDDYGDRPWYNEFNKLITPTKMVGRTAVYEINPTKYDKVELIKKYTKVYMDWS